MAGLDKKVIGEINWARAISNILVDIRTDFVLAPHLDIIFREKGTELIEQLKARLASGTYEPQLPITVSAPKSDIMTRPGSILLPHDRLLYQALVETCLPEVEKEFDRTVSFSHEPAAGDGHLFTPSSVSWQRYQEKVETICKSSAFVFQGDVANYFEMLPQHNLINALEGAGVKSEVVRLLEKLLLAFRQNSSQGIIQGIYPSDVLGNFYLTDIDGKLILEGLPSARYVDDIFVGFDTDFKAKSFAVKLVDDMRKVGLTLNPSKTKIVRGDDLLYEQQEVDTYFNAARAEVEAVAGLDDDNGYGFQGDWINSDEVQEAVDDGVEEELIAVRALLEYRLGAEDIGEKIDRFCLPYLRAADDDYGIDHAFTGLELRPHLSRLYFSYLSHFAATDQAVRQKIEVLIQENGFYLDYQVMYHMAGVMSCESVGDATVAKVVSWYDSPRLGIPTKALAAVFIAKLGNASQRRNLRRSYEDQTAYVQAAILYGAQYFVAAEKATMKKAWRGHSDIHALIAASI